MRTENEKTEEKQKIKELIDKGLTNKQIGELLDMKYRTVCFKLREYQLTRYSKPKISQEIINEIIKMYNEGYNCTEIKNKINLSKVTIYLILKENGITIFRRNSKKSLRLRLEISDNCQLCNNTLKTKGNICGTCRTNIRRYKIKLSMFNLKGGKCQDCGSDDLDISCYDFHHLDPTKKEFQLSGTQANKLTSAKIKVELEKCVLLCSNCHRTRHVKIRSDRFWEYLQSCTIAKMTQVEN